MANSITRGHGLLENFLSKKRAEIADLSIPDYLRDGKILDLGCGFYPYFLSAIKFKAKFGINSEFSNQPVSGISLIKCDFNTNTVLPFSDSSFNVVAMLAVAEHLESNIAVALLKEARRVLSSGGILIITTPWGKADLFLRFLSKIKILSSVEINEHKQFYDDSLIKNQLVLSGFSAEKIKIKKFELGFNFLVLVEK